MGGGQEASEDGSHVPQGLKPLGPWARDQRYYKKNNKLSLLSKERIAQVRAAWVGAVWLTLGGW